MSYEKQTWQTGDIVTSAKLNHMEDGIENAQFPAVTNSDVGKVLTVEEKSVQGAVLVPEETFVFTDGIMAEINMQNKSLFVEGAECLLTVDGTTITATVQAVSEPDSGLIVQDNETGITILLEDSTNVAKLYVPNTGTYTVSLYVEGTEYGWTPVEPSGGGVQTVYVDNQGDGYLCTDSADPTTYLSWNDLSEILSEGKQLMLFLSAEDGGRLDINDGFFPLYELAKAGSNLRAQFGGINFIANDPDNDLIFD